MKIILLNFEKTTAWCKHVRIFRMFCSKARSASSHVLSATSSRLINREAINILIEITLLPAMNVIAQVSIFFTLLLVHQIRSQIISFGGCPRVQPMNNLKLDAVTGKWFEISKYSSMFASGECASIEFELVSDKNISLNVKELVKGKNSSFVQFGKIESPGVWNFQLKTPISKFFFH